jgi:hypothetical protein
MQITNIGQSDGDYTLIPSQMGDEMLCIKAIVPNTDQFNGAIFVPDSLHKNERMFYYEIIKQGSKVNEILGLNEGDFIFVDMLARYADTFPISFINVRGVLFKTDKDAKTISALKNRVVIKIVEPHEKVNEFGLIQITEIDPYGEVTSIGDDCEDRGIRLGDHIGVNSAKDSSMYIFRGNKYFDINPYTPKFKFTDR